MPYPTSRWIGSSSSACMQRWIPFPWLIFGNAPGVQAPSHGRATPCLLACLCIHFMHLQQSPLCGIGHCHLPQEAAMTPPPSPSHLPWCLAYHSIHTFLAFPSLQDLQHTRSHCPKCTEHPRLSSTKGYNTTPAASTKVNSRHSEASVPGITSQHSLPWRTC